MSDTRNHVAAGIERLGAWITSIRLEDIPRPVLARAVRVLADDLGAIVGARDEPEVVRFHARTLATAGSAEATVFRGAGTHQRSRTDRRNAAVANGLAADWLELDEGYRVTPCHAGLYVIPAPDVKTGASGIKLSPFGLFTARPCA